MIMWFMKKKTKMEKAEENLTKVTEKANDKIAKARMKKANVQAQNLLETLDPEILRATIKKVVAEMAEPEEKKQPVGGYDRGIGDPMANVKPQFTKVIEPEVMSPVENGGIGDPSPKAEVVS